MVILLVSGSEHMLQTSIKFRYQVAFIVGFFLFEKTAANSSTCSLEDRSELRSSERMLLMTSQQQMVASPVASDMAEETPDVLLERQGPSSAGFPAGDVMQRGGAPSAEVPIAGSGPRHEPGKTKGKGKFKIKGKVKSKGTQGPGPKGRGPQPPPEVAGPSEPLVIGRNLETTNAPTEITEKTTTVVPTEAGSSVSNAGDSNNYLKDGALEGNAGEKASATTTSIPAVDPLVEPLVDPEVIEERQPQAESPQARQEVETEDVQAKGAEQPDPASASSGAEADPLTESTTIAPATTSKDVATGSTKAGEVKGMAAKNKIPTGIVFFASAYLLMSHV